MTRKLCSAFCLFALLAMVATVFADDEGDGEGECTDLWPDHCPDRVEKTPRECYDEGIAKGCCKSCAAVKEDVEGCEYGNKAGWCEESDEAQDQDCSDDYVAKNCCK